MSKSAKTKMDDLLATESDQLQEQKIHKIRATMEALVYGSEKVSTTKGRQFQVCLNRARQVATTWTEADHQKAIEQLERKIHQVTPAKHNLVDKLFQRHEQQLLPEAGTKGTSPKSKYAKELALKKTAVEDVVYAAPNMTADRQLPFQICLSYAETEATT